MVDYGPLTAPAIGRLVKEMVRRAIIEIRKPASRDERSRYKRSDGTLDFVMQADLAAQAIYRRLITEDFPGYGIRAEEGNLDVACTLDGMDAYFTVDPLDGTRAFQRGQSFGVGTQIALVIDHKDVACAYVGDVTTFDIFGYRPESNAVHHIDASGTAVDLTTVHHTRLLADQVALLREMPEDHHPLVARLAQPISRGGLFREYQNTSGSIGLSMSRLWKGEVGMHAMAPGRETPWDRTPLVGICQRLDMVWLRPTTDGDLVADPPRVCRDVYPREHDVVVVHSSKVAELQDAARRLRDQCE
jgi:fructose-1,6-bisphosphatase/inositol monophosphatase family enzyme